MAPAQKSQQKRAPKSSGKSKAALAPVDEKSAGLWKFFPLLTALVGVFVGLLLKSSSWEADNTVATNAGEP